MATKAPIRGVERQRKQVAAGSKHKPQSSFSIVSFDAAVNETEAFGTATVEFIGHGLIAAGAPIQEWLDARTPSGRPKRDGSKARKVQEELLSFTESDAFKQALPAKRPSGITSATVRHYVEHSHEDLWNWLRLHNPGKRKSESPGNLGKNLVSDQSQEATASRLEPGDAKTALEYDQDSPADGQEAEKGQGSDRDTEEEDSEDQDLDTESKPITTYELASMDQTQAFVDRHLDSSDLHRVSVSIEWDVHKFSHEELEPGQKLENLFIATGDPARAWAGRCGDYVQSTWPRIGPIILNAVQQYIFPVESKPWVCSFCDERDFEIQVNGSLTRFEVQGTQKDIVEAIQQLAWLASTLRTTSEEEFHICYSDSTAGFSLEPIGKVLDSASHPKGTRNDDRADPIEYCWESLVEGPCVPGFPIPARAEEYVGLEIDFDTLLKLACIQYPVYRGNTIAFRGWQTLLYPVSASPDFSCIQWHIIYGESPGDLRLADGLAKLSDIKTWKSCDINVIRNARSFLGYSEYIHVNLGTEDHSLQDPGQKSGARIEEGGGAFWQKKVTFSLGTSFMGFGNAGVGGEIGFRKRQLAKMASFNNFDRVLERSAETTVLMYDVKWQTAWLVPELSVVLHITRSWFMKLGDASNDEILNVPAAEIEEDGGKAALRCIKRHRDLKIEYNDSSWEFMSIIKDSVNMLDACRQTRDPAETANAQSRIKSIFYNPRLYGWDLADLVVAHASTLRKETTLDVNTGDKWISHVANHPSMLVLFCRDIDQPITLPDPSEMCRYWDPIPSGCNFLVATAHCLKALSSQCNGNHAQGKLTDACWLTRPDGTKPFKTCKFSRSSCKRLHQIVTKTPVKRQALPTQGAVVFGAPDLEPNRICLRKKQAVKEPEEESFKDEEDNTVTASNNDSISDPAPDDLQSHLSRSSSRTSLPLTSSQYRRDPNSPDFGRDCHALILALADRQSIDVSADDIDQLIDEGRKLLEREKRLEQTVERLKGFNTAIRDEIWDCEIDIGIDFGEEQNNVEDSEQYEGGESADLYD